MANEQKQNAGKVVLVTGGGRGLGAAICEALARDGMAIAVADLNQSAARDTLGTLRDAGANAMALGLDVQSETSVQQAIGDVVAHFGRLDALVNNAAIDVTKSIEELGSDEWMRIVATNLTGPFLMAKHALPQLRENKGAVINIASTASRRAWPNAAAYHATKWGLLGLSHALHAELRPQGVKVTAVLAGGMRTPFLLDRFPDIDTGLLQDPANVAEAVRFALSQPLETVIPEIMVLPMRETSWP